MTVVNYFSLTNSTQDITKRFKVILPGYRPIKEKSQSAEKTLEGEWDVSQGAIFKRHEYIVRAKAEEADTAYGTLADLEIFFDYNSPVEQGGNPSNRFTMVDHYGDSWLVILYGDFVPEPLGVMLEGPDAVFLVPITILFLGPVEGS